MADHDHSTHDAEPGRSFWRSRAGWALIAFLAIAALLLGYEHRVHLFGGNMFTALLLLSCVGMHFFMHGSHGGGHAGHGGHGRNSKDDTGEKP